MQKQNHNRIEQAQNKWIQRLTDLSRRNNLVYYRELKNGTIELIDVNIQAFDELLLGKPVSANDLFPNKCNEIHFKQQVLIYTIMLFSFSGLYKLILPIIKDYPEINREINTEVIKKIQNIYKRSISNLEERGLRTLFLAYGMVTWTANDGGRNPQAPLVLIPISIQTKGEIKLIRSGEAQINPVLLYFLEKEYGYQITSEQLLNGDSDIPENEVPDLQNIADKFTNIIKNIPSFTIDQSRAILSNFAFQKMSMVRDLRDNFRVLSDNKLILALAGDVSSQQSLRGNSYDDILNNTSKLDQIKPDDEFLVFDADSSQQRVIYTALKGNNIVIQGPPGTGKSQTIANLIVSFAAQGKKVLFVAEKRAALEVVKKRLEQKDLGHLLLDLHGSDISRKLVMEQIAESLTLIRNSSPINTDLIHNNFIDKRNNLNNHVRLIHIKRQPYQKSVYELQAEILFFQDKPELQCLTRFRGHILEKITSNLSQIENLLTQLMSPNLLPLFLEETSSPWLKINFSSREDAIKIGDLVTKINQILRLNILDPVFSISLEYGINSVKNIQDIISLIEISDKINNFYSLYNADLFDHNLQEYLQILYPLQNYEDARKFDTIIYLLNSGSDLCSDQFMQKLDDFIKLSSEINRTLSIYNEKIFKEDLETIIKDLSSGDSGFFGILNFFNEKLNNARSKIKKLRFSTDISDQDLIVETKRALEQLRKWTKLFPHKSFPEKIYLLSDNNYQLKEILLSKHFWDVFSDLRKLRYSSSNSINQIIKELEQANELLQQWRLLSSSFLYPQKIIHNQKLKDTLSDLLKDLKLIESKFNNINFINLPLEELENLFKELSDHSELPLLLATLQEIEKNINNCGANDILREFKNTKSDPSLWLKKFRYAWLYSCLEKAYIEEPYLRTFHGKNHNQIVSEFRKLDQERLNIAQLRVKRNHAEKAISTMNKYPQEESLVRREANKKSRHLPLRKLLEKAPHVLTSLRPCWMTSPLSVSQLLDAKPYFDVVIFDEASQVLPEDTIPALMRGEQLIVAGDRYQLPPTNFFTINSDEDEMTEDISSTEGFESFLDLTSSFLNDWQLQWHYRSRSEELIAFSNHHIYGDRLITFPGIKNADVISHVLVPSIPDQDGQEESARNEVEKVVEIILKHAMEKPNETLGVITMGIKHAQKIEFVLEQQLKERPELTPFFNEDNYEHFFIKNIEKVQGDERDTIILSIGYGKDRSGNLPHRFGPLLYQGGERRLNVAISRARKSMILVSSFSHHDIDLNKTKARGVELLKFYIQYAASGGKLLGDKGISEIPLNPFEQDIFDNLTNQGISLIPQWGVSNYRIDMVAKHPEKPGEFVLAIECDGATYHSSPTARERDRLRQQQLESLGWRFHRIWSIDWFNNKQEEIKRTITAFEEAVQYANNQSIQKSIDHNEQDENLNHNTILNDIKAKIRCPKPNIPEKSYNIQDIIKIVEWILSDGNLPTDEELLKETRSELGFKRSGKKIDDIIRDAIKIVNNKL
ncbi:AAA domain-containing protein [Sphaerospermopsis sp. LEGE 08334]|uniref:AAA domain-containing protein n=1 Tax=Sphaerospermopsis sp. LEGE 08334 TaxID=1828651 RepID=UPI00187F54F1|nr:AAA domain-containing protein [Sphaerospermopsis sp. LEGE 08334]MBE9055169.1 DUF4011 domain-containing protein [Sphaerospermopsis sp. LEGE 08334]